MNVDMEVFGSVDEQCVYLLQLLIFSLQQLRASFACFARDF